MNSMDAVMRRELLDEFFANRDRLERLSLRNAISPDEEKDRSCLMARQGELLKKYREELPRVPIARCPFSGEIYSPAIDIFGIDGPWWDYYSSQRPFEEPPSHWIALAGAMSFAAEIETTPQLVIPGPAVPYVHTRLMEHDYVKAVVYSFPVGAHTAYATTYFASQWPEGIQMPNIWGVDFYRIHLADGDAGWYQTYEDEHSRDFDLARWIEAGKLHWIAAEDSALNLKTTVEDCPYVGLAGCRDEQRVSHGIVESGEPE